jgi:hypothetical protein
MQGGPRQMNPQQQMMMRQIQQIHQKIRSENPDMPEEEVKKRVMATHNQMMMKMKEQHEKLQKDMQDPEKRKKIEEAKKQQEDGMKVRSDKLTAVAKKIDHWGLKTHATVLGPNTIDYFRMDNFSEIVLEHKEEIRNDLIELFPKMPEIKAVRDCVELCQV